jgi:hypothetical protein
MRHTTVTNAAAVVSGEHDSPTIASDRSQIIWSDPRSRSDRLNGSHLFRQVILGGNAGRSVWVHDTYERRPATAADHEYSMAEKRGALRHYYTFLALRLQALPLPKLEESRQVWSSPRGDRRLWRGAFVVLYIYSNSQACASLCPLWSLYTFDQPLAQSTDMLKRYVPCAW